MIFQQIANLYLICIEDLFNYLPSLSSSNLSFSKSEGNLSIKIRLDILGKQKTIDLPLAYQSIQTTIDPQPEFKSKLDSIVNQYKRLERSIQISKQIVPQQLVFFKENVTIKESAQEKYEDIQRKRIKMQQNKLIEQNQIVKIEKQSPMREVAILGQNTNLIQQTQSTNKLFKSQIFNIQTLKQSYHLSLKVQPSIYNRYFLFSCKRIMLAFQFKDFHQVSSSVPFSILQQSFIGIRILKSTKNNIYFCAFVQTRRKQKYTCQQQRAISLKLSGGRFLYEDGKQSGVSMPYLKKEEVMYLCIDPITFEIIWFIEPKYTIRRPLPSVFRNQLLYPFVSLHDDGDEVELV